MYDLVILAGGKGTRIKKLLKNRCKPMAKFGLYNFLDYLLFTYSKFFFNKIFIIAGYKGHLIKSKYHNLRINLSKIEVIVEKKTKGTGGCLLEIKNRIKNDFFVINGDTIFDINIFNLCSLIKKKHLASIALVQNKKIDNTKLNNLKINKKNDIAHTKHSIYMNGGVYFFKNRFLKFLKKEHSSLEEDIMSILIKKRLVCGKYFKNFFIDIGSIKKFYYAKKKLNSIFYKPAIFLDRDGVINYDYGYTYKIKDIFFIKKTINFLKKFRDKYYFFIITNQSGIGRGKFSINKFNLFQREIYSRLSKKNFFFNDIQFCPHHPQAKLKIYKKICSCRKPGNLMIRNILKLWPVNKKKSFFIGDKLSDYQAAKKSRLRYLDISQI